MMVVLEDLFFLVPYFLLEVRVVSKLLEEKVFFRLC